MAGRPIPTVLLLLLPLLLSAAPAPVRWDFVVTIPDLARGLAEVDFTLYGFAGEVQICADMDGAERHVRRLWQRLPSGLKVIERPRPDAECWVMDAPASGPLRLRYQYDLAALARASGTPDYASRLGDDYVFNDEALLLRPDPLPRGAPIEVELRLPPGAQVAAPWQRLPGAEHRFRYDSDHYGTGSYVAIGRIRSLGAVRVDGGSAELHLVDRPLRASDAVLRRWVEEPLREVSRFYGEVPWGRVHVVLMPVPGEREPGVFGIVLRRGPPSLTLFVGAEAEEAEFRRDWTVFHELFHLGNPLLDSRPYWFIEGVTTYYQDVLRARAGVESADAMWGDLHDGFRRHCSQQRTASLRRESAALRQTHRYPTVYWGGACVCFLLDVAIRERSGGGRSLDDALRDLRRRGLQRLLTEEELVTALDQAAGQPGMTRQLLDSRRPLPIKDAYRRLGIEPVGPDRVRLLDDAPLAKQRDAIMAPAR